MHMVGIFGLTALLLIVAFAANRLSKLTRVPDVVVLLIVGITVGPILHWVHAHTFRDSIRILGTFALILILFEGGLELRLRKAVRYFPAGLLLVCLSFGLSLALVAVIGKLLLHLPWLDCLLLGAALGCSSGTIVIPALEQINTPEAVKVTLTLESALGEVIAVLLVGSLLHIEGQSSLIGGLATNFSQHIIVSLALGFGAAVVWSNTWPRIANQPNTNILNLGIVMGVYAIGEYLHGSGLLTVLVFGVTLANLPRTPRLNRLGLRMLAFHAEFSFLVRSFFFVLLGIVAEFVSRQYIVPILGILAALVAARYVAVEGSRWVLRDVARRDSELLFWMLPRGLVTAVLALEIVNDRGPAFSFLPAMAFTVVLVTNLFIVWGAVRAGSVSTTLETEAAMSRQTLSAPETLANASGAGAAGGTV